MKARLPRGKDPVELGRAPRSGGGHGLPGRGLAILRSGAGRGAPWHAATRDLVARDRARSPDFTTLANHILGAEAADEPKAQPEAALHAADLRVPLLVIHGSADPLFLLAHGEAVVAAVPNARLERIEGGGHEIHAKDVDQVVRAIAAHAGSCG